MPRPRLSNDECNAQIVVFGESGVGKTCFTDMFLDGNMYILHNAVASEPRNRIMTIGDQTWKIWLMDLNSTILRDPEPGLDTEFFQNYLARADGIVLLYDITSQQSFDLVTNQAYIYAWTHRRAVGAKGEKYSPGRQSFGCVLVGNKVDLVKLVPQKRQVDKDMAEQWAQSQGFEHFELTTHSTYKIEDAIMAVIKDVKRTRRQDAQDVEERKNLDAIKQRQPKQGSKMSLRRKISQALRKSKPSS